MTTNPQIRPKLGVVKFLGVLVKFEGRSRGDVIFFMLIIIMNQKLLLRALDEVKGQRCRRRWKRQMWSWLKWIETVSQQYFSLHCLFIYIFHTGVSQQGEQGKANRHPPLLKVIKQEDQRTLGVMLCLGT